MEYIKVNTLNDRSTREVTVHKNLMITRLHLSSFIYSLKNGQTDPI